VRLVLLGDPVDHSRSPAIHIAALAAAGIEGSYEAMAVDRAGLVRVVEAIAAGRIQGANVTMPHKAAAAEVAEGIDALVEATGAANTLRTSATVPGTVEATNTDVGGLQSAAERAGLPADAPVVILGAGGAASAATHAFADREVLVSSRSGRPVGEYGSVSWGEPVPGAVVVNATPLGMAGESLPAGLVESASGLLDMAYGSNPTPAMEVAVRRGIPAADGLDVLVAQAAISFRWWTGVPAPLDHMHMAARSF